MKCKTCKSTNIKLEKKASRYPFIEAKCKDCNTIWNIYNYSDMDGLAKKEQFFYEILQDDLGKKIGKFTFYQEKMSGAFFFSSGKVDIYCSPFWNESEGINLCIDFNIPEYNLISINNISPIYINVTFNAEKDRKTFFELMGKIIAFFT